MDDRWINVVFRIKDSQKTVKFKDIVDFVKAEAKKANDPTYGKSAMNSKMLPACIHSVPF
jgi:hypothetical protein